MNNLLSQSFNFSGGLPKVRDSYIEDGSAAGNPNPGMDLTEFNAEVVALERAQDELCRTIKDVKRLHQETASVIAAGAAKQVQGRLKAKVEEATALGKRLRDGVEKLKKSNENNQSYPGCHKGSPTDRHRSAVAVSLARSLKSALEDFSNVRNQMQQAQRDAMSRRVKLLTGRELDNSDLERLLRSGKGEQELLRAAVAQQGDTQSVREALLDIEERKASVNDIARSLEELQQLMLDMALLVDEQQEVLDEIELNVGAAHEEVKVAGTELVTAVKTRQNMRKWVCIGVSVLIVILLIIILPIVIKAIPKGA